MSNEDIKAGAGAEPPERSRLAGALLIAVVLAGAVLALFHHADRRAPVMKPTLEHRASLGGTMPASCLECHARSGPLPQKPGHTGRQDCATCHRLGE